jgi:hypothetical protein
MGKKSIFMTMTCVRFSVSYTTSGNHVAWLFNSRSTWKFFLCSSYTPIQRRYAVIDHNRTPSCQHSINGLIWSCFRGLIQIPVYSSLFLDCFEAQYVVKISSWAAISESVFGSFAITKELGPNVNIEHLLSMDISSMQIKVADCRSNRLVKHSRCLHNVTCC